MPHARPLGLLIALLLPAATPVMAGVLVVDAAGGGHHADIQSAVDAAHPGDLVLVRAGNYPGFTLAAKALDVVGDAATPQLVQVQGVVTVRDTAPAQAVLIARLWIVPPAAAGPADRDALTVISAQGPVHLSEVRAFGPRSLASLPSPDAVGGRGLFVRDSAEVVAESCVFAGGQGHSSLPVAAPGGTGARLRSARVSLWHCAVEGGLGGGDGLPQQVTGGAGGTGMQLEDATLYAAGGSVRGGQGGFAGFSAPPGGTGLEIDAASTATLRAVTVAGGDGGWDMSVSVMGAPGAATAGAGLVVQLAGPVPESTSPHVVVRPDELILYDLEPAGPALLLVSLMPGWVDLPAWSGPLHVGDPFLLGGAVPVLTPLAVVGGTLPPAADGVRLVMQMGVAGSGLGNPRPLLLVNGP